MQITGWVWRQTSKKDRLLMLAIQQTRTSQKWSMRKALNGLPADRAR